MRTDLLKRTVPFLAAFATASLACTVETADGNNDSLVDEDDPAGKEDGVVRPEGTFRQGDAAAGEPTLLVLKTDKTYHMEVMVYCVRFPCNPIVYEGNYKYTISRGTRYIKFFDGDGELVDRFAYTFVGDQFDMRRVGTDTWFDLQLSSDAWCAMPGDCELQGLFHIECVGEWGCESNACSFDCGVPVNSCEDNGGTCTAVRPGGCPDGTEPADAAEYSCGPEGAIGAMCCMPVEEPNACEAAGGMCVGLRPDACPDGYVNANAEDYPCGPEGLLGTTCCLPQTACKPECRAVGTRSEGWYDGCTGELICWVRCSGSEAVCDAIGSRSEGWYSSGGAGTGCGLSGALIHWDRCAS